MIKILWEGLKKRFLAFGMIYFHFYNTWKSSMLKLNKIELNEQNCPWNVQMSIFVKLALKQHSKLFDRVYFSQQRKNILTPIIIIWKGLKTDFWPLGRYITIFTTPWKPFNIEINQNDQKLFINMKNTMFWKMSPIIFKMLWKVYFLNIIHYWNQQTLIYKPFCHSLCLVPDFLNMFWKMCVKLVYKDIYVRSSWHVRPPPECHISGNDNS